MDEHQKKLMKLINEGLDRYHKAHAKYISGKGGLTFPTEARYIAEVLIENGITLPNCTKEAVNHE